jgi:hypothetical protein
MPITDTNVIDGPEVQADGQHRGTMEFIFDDGRRVERQVRRPDAITWANAILDMPAMVEKEIQEQDAEEAVGSDVEVAAYKQASMQQLAIQYLRRAHSQDDPYVAFLQFSRFNTWRIAQGYNVNQVAAALASVGLTDEEWTLMLDAYQWVSNPARVTAMQAYQDIISTWPSFKG